MHVWRLGHLVRRDDDVVRADVAEHALREPRALGGVARVELDDAQARAPARELARPRAEHRERAEHEERARQPPLELEVREEGDRLQRLAQPHLVAQDPAHAVCVRPRQGHSGVVGFLLYRIGAGQLTQTGVEVIYERIPLELHEIRERSEKILLECTEETSSDTLAKHYEDTLSWFFRKPRFYWQNIFGLQSADHWMRFHAESVVRYLDEKETAHFDELLTLMRVKRKIDHHYAAQDLMKKWLLVHLPLSIALLVLAVWHWFLIEVYAI